MLEIQHQPTFSDIETTYPKLPVDKNAYTKLLFANGSLFGIGNDGNITRVFQMNLADTEMNWKEVASLKESRTNFGAALFDSDCIIIAGRVGKDDRTVALYDLHSNEWKSYAMPDVIIHLCPVIKVLSLLGD